MTRKQRSQNQTEKDPINEALSSGSCHIVLETFPPDYVEKISRYLESSEVQGRQNKPCNDPAAGESDSGDSLFITQDPVAAAVRTGKRNCKTPTSPRDLEESEDDSSSSDSLQESTPKTKARNQNISLPKFTFPFVGGRRRERKLTVDKNTSLHYATMGGFFKCVSERWQGSESRNKALLLPTVDLDGEDISPLSEDEEMLEAEDIKVVEKKCFLVGIKKCSQPLRNAKREMSQGSQRKRICVSSDTKALGDGGPFRAPAEKQTGDTHKTDILKQTEAPKKSTRLRGIKNVPIQEEDREEEVCNDSDATVCEPPQHEGSRQEHIHVPRGSEAVIPPTVVETKDLFQFGQEEDEPDSQSLLQSLPHVDDGVGPDITVKIRKKKKKLKDHYRSENHMKESLHDNILGLEERDYMGLMQTKRNSKKLHTENVGHDGVKNSEPDEVSVMFNKETIRKKKKKSKNNVKDGEGVEQVQDRKDDDAETQRENKQKNRNSEDETVNLANESVTLEQSTGLIVKKKKKKKISEGENISSAPDECDKLEYKDNSQATIDGSEEQEAEQVTKKKKKKRKKEKMDEITCKQIPEDSDGQSAEAASVWSKEQKRASSFPKADSEEKDGQKQPNSGLTSEAAGVWAGTTVVADVDSESTQITVHSDDEVSKKKKKKKKRKMSDTQDNVEEEHRSGFLEPNVMEQELVLSDSGVKKKKKKKRTEHVSVSSVEKLDSDANDGESQTHKDEILKKTCFKKHHKDSQSSSKHDNSERTKQSHKKKKSNC